jgi:hypothetical protein
MGWKAFNLFATVREEAYLTTFPAPEPGKARALLEKIGGKYESQGESTLERGLYPKGEDELYVGAYDRAIVLGSMSVAEHVFDGEVPEVVGHVEAMLPGARVLIVLLHSVVGLWGYAWFERGKLLRARAGNADDGVFLDLGELLPLEEKLRARDPEIDGEEMVMELCRPFLGCRLDELDHWELRMELFRRVGR